MVPAVVRVYITSLCADTVSDDVVNYIAFFEKILHEYVIVMLLNMLALKLFVVFDSYRLSVHKSNGQMYLPVA